MIRKFKNITTLLLLLAFLLPSLIKLEHHHKNFIFKEKNEKLYLVIHEECAVCNFEFSFFSSDTENIVSLKEDLLDSYFNNYNFWLNTNLSRFSFLLRAPPVRQI